ncbi:MAG: hypothetical protein HKN14_15270 [Marinicaulis sp.]|nr:hypothetical protein [Marinicaulis sp.]NNL87496.1 hypothetical protein [Marinicaulis sp.]
MANTPDKDLEKRLSIGNTLSDARIRDLAAMVVAGVVIGAWAMSVGEVTILNVSLVSILFVTVGVAAYFMMPRANHAEETALFADNRALELSGLESVLGALPAPIFILNKDAIIVSANRAAEDFSTSSPLIGAHIATALRAPEVFEAIEVVLAGGVSKEVEFVTISSVERTCRAQITAVEEQIIVFVQDLTTQRRLDQMRADFIASASHELRTPLASLIGFIETLRGHARTDIKAQKKFLKIMHSQAERMQRLVSDLMSLSRIELNEHVPPHDIIDLAEVSEDVIESLDPILKASDAIVDFTNELNGGANIVGDRDEIFQAIQNLLDNAVKYGGENPMIKLRVGHGEAPSLTSTEGEPGHRAGDSAAQSAARLGVSLADLIYVQIRDFGPGIERADLPRLTERFYRVNVERSKKSGGTGLGLAIVKHIVNRHRGGFQIESRLAGGTAFNCYFSAISRES